MPMPFDARLNALVESAFEEREPREALTRSLLTDGRFSQDCGSPEINSGIRLVPSVEDRDQPHTWTGRIRQPRRVCTRRRTT
jgi:hypothetical protein